jgi:23S rRNA pseudouridine1911/1915/1917 synthase
MEDLLFHDSRSNRTFPVKRMRKGVKEARLSYKVISYNGEKDISFVAVTLDTGRTHQIRTQFASRKHPLAGDGKYGSRIKCPIALVMAELTYDEGEGTEPITVKTDPKEELPEV